jgi:hypothetical protein
VRGCTWITLARDKAREGTSQNTDPAPWTYHRTGDVWCPHKRQPNPCNAGSVTCVSVQESPYEGVLSDTPLGSGTAPFAYMRLDESHVHPGTRPRLSTAEDRPKSPERGQGR